jgi:hypothetical protein
MDLSLATKKKLNHDKDIKLLIRDKHSKYNMDTI